MVFAVCGGEEEEEELVALDRNLDFNLQNKVQ